MDLFQSVRAGPSVTKTSALLAVMRSFNNPSTTIVGQTAFAIAA